MAESIKAKVMWMNGGRIDGYFYVGIEGTDLVACEDGHPDFPLRFPEGEKGSERRAKKLATEIRKQIKEV